MDESILRTPLTRRNVLSALAVTPMLPWQQNPNEQQSMPESIVNCSYNELPYNVSPHLYSQKEPRQLLLPILVVDLKDLINEFGERVLTGARMSVNIATYSNTYLAKKKPAADTIPEPTKDDLTEWYTPFESGFDSPYNIYSNQQNSERTGEIGLGSGLLILPILPTIFKKTAFSTSQNLIDWSTVCPNLYPSHSINLPAFPDLFPSGANINFNISVSLNPSGFSERNSNGLSMGSQIVLNQERTVTDFDVSANKLFENAIKTVEELSNQYEEKKPDLNNFRV